MSIESILICMGVYYALTGLWAIVHIKSFMWVTGPKTDIWLVKTVSLMILSSGLVFLQAGCAHQVTTSIRYLALLNAGALAFIDFYYPLKGVIRKIYMLDGLVEVVFIVFILLAQ